MRRYPELSQVFVCPLGDLASQKSWQVTWPASSGVGSPTCIIGGMIRWVCIQEEGVFIWVEGSLQPERLDRTPLACWNRENGPFKQESEIHFLFNTVQVTNNTKVLQIQNTTLMPWVQRFSGLISCDLKQQIKRQEWIPGCIPPACCPHLPGLGGGCVPGLGGVPGPGGTPGPGVHLVRGAPTQVLPPVNRMTNRCKNITWLQTSFAGGNKYL